MCAHCDVYWYWQESGVCLCERPSEKRGRGVGFVIFMSDLCTVDHVCVNNVSAAGKDLVSSLCVWVTLHPLKCVYPTYPVINPLSSFHCSLVNCAW